MRIQPASCSTHCQAPASPPCEGALLLQQCCSTWSYTGNKSTEETPGKSREGCMHREGTHLNQTTLQINTRAHAQREAVASSDRKVILSEKEDSTQKNQKKNTKPLLYCCWSTKTRQETKSKATADYKPTSRILQAHSSLCFSPMALLSPLALPPQHSKQEKR